MITKHQGNMRKVITKALLGKVDQLVTKFVLLVLNSPLARASVRYYSRLKACYRNTNNGLRKKQRQAFWGSWLFRLIEESILSKGIKSNHQLLCWRPKIGWATRTRKSWTTCESYLTHQTHKGERPALNWTHALQWKLRQFFGRNVAKNIKTETKSFCA